MKNNERKKDQNKKMKNEKVTQSKLQEIADERSAIRAGSTGDPDKRARDYAQEGYAGTLYYAPTENMMKSEDKILRGRNFRHNEQELSNASESPGNVYVIKGKKSKEE